MRNLLKSIKYNFVSVGSETLATPIISLKKKPDSDNGAFYTSIV